MQVFSPLTHCGLVTSYGDRDLGQNQNQNQNPLLTSLYTHNKYMAYVNSSEMLTIYLVLVVHE